LPKIAKFLQNLVQHWISMVLRKIGNRAPPFVVRGGPKWTNFGHKWPPEGLLIWWSDMVWIRFGYGLDPVWILVGSTHGASQLTYWNQFWEYGLPSFSPKGTHNNQNLAQNNCRLGCLVWGCKALRSDWIEVGSSHGTSHPTYQNQIYDLGTPNFGRERPKNAHENGQQAHLGAIFRKIWASFRSH